MTLITRHMHCVIFGQIYSKTFEWITRLKSFTKSNTLTSCFSEDMVYNCYFTNRVIQNYFNNILPAIKPLLVRKNSDDLRSNQNGKEKFVFPSKPPFLHILQRKRSEMLSKYSTSIDLLLEAKNRSHYKKDLSFKSGENTTTNFFLNFSLRILKETKCNCDS